MSPRPTSGPAAAQLRVLGFPVHIRRGFLVFLVLLAVLPRGGDPAFGFWLAGGVAVFTLIHELGHATVARRAGAEAEISLEFMAGFASYRSAQPLGRMWTIAISLAGPLVHIAAGLAVLTAMGVHPLQRPDSSWSIAALAIWWAGPVIGVFNLIPVLPLDGGHVATTALDAIIPGRAHKVMTYASVAITGVALVSTGFVDATRGMTVFIGFLFVLQLSSLFDLRQREATSPFDAASTAYRAGDRAKAVRILDKGLRRPAAGHVVPEALYAPDQAVLRALVSELPRPLSHGNSWNEYLLATLLVRFGQAREAADYGAASFAREPNGLAACGIARAAAALDDGATSAAWLRAAGGAGVPHDELQKLVRSSPEFATVRLRADVQSAVGGPGSAPAAEPRFT